MLVVFWISFFFYFRSGNGLNHHIRHEFTRYLIGRNQLYGDNYSRQFDFTQNYIPFVHYWEKPLQIMESSMNLPKKLVRPLFSWDLPVQVSTYTPVRKMADQPTELSTSENPIQTTTEDSSWSFIDDTKHSDSNSVTYIPKTIEKTRSDRLNRAKDSVTNRNSYVYVPTPTKKKKSSNRKKSVEGLPQTKSLKWTESSAQNPNSTKYANESNGKPLKKKKKGKKSKKGKTEKNGKRNRGRNESNVEINEVNPKKTGSKADYLDKKLMVEKILKDRQKIMFSDQMRETTTEDQLPKKSACELMEDKCEHSCKDENGKAVCVCFRGFYPIGTKCIDVNECETNNGGCNGKCVNTIGSRKCFCSPGFRLIDDACADINECLLRNGHGPCQDRCTNTLGSYNCSCEGLPGTVLSSDKHTCKDVSECDSDSAGCSHSCISISGRAFCTCPDGLELGEDWKTCHDIDECSNPEDYGIGCEFGCINTIGSYKCAKENQTSDDST